MNGHVLREVPIAVDMWNMSAIREAKLFFLSHAHADHIQGLMSTWKFPIYTSHVTAQIVKLKLKVNDNRLKRLEIGQPHLISLGNETITVYLIDANHCPGAVMFIFQGNFGTILYTGDFRFNSEMENEIKIAAPGGIDVLYLDNTYCEPKCKFDVRDKVMKDILRTISAHFDDHSIVIGMKYLGKEEVLVKIAKQFMRKICVDKDKFKLLQTLKMNNVFTTNKNETNIKVVPFKTITAKNIKLWNKIKPTIGILFTSLFCGIEKYHLSHQKKIFVFPYSDHSSYEELRKFVRIVRPKVVYPIVNQFKHEGFGITPPKIRANMAVFYDLLNSSPLKNISRTSNRNEQLYSLEKRMDKKLSTNVVKSLKTFSPSIKTKGVVFNTLEISPAKCTVAETKEISMSKNSLEDKKLNVDIVSHSSITSTTVEKNEFPAKKEETITKDSTVKILTGESKCNTNILVASDESFVEFQNNDGRNDDSFIPGTPEKNSSYTYGLVTPESTRKTHLENVKKSMYHCSLYEKIDKSSNAGPGINVKELVITWQKKTEQFNTCVQRVKELDKSFGNRSGKTNFLSEKRKRDDDQHKIHDLNLKRTKLTKSYEPEVITLD